MNTELIQKLQELRDLMVVKGDVDLVDECIALAGQAHPKGYVMSEVAKFDEWPAPHSPVGGEEPVTVEQVQQELEAWLKSCGSPIPAHDSYMDDLRTRLSSLFTHPKGGVGELTDEAFVKEWLISSGRIISPNGGTLLDEAAQPLCVFLKHALDNGYLTKK